MKNQSSHQNRQPIKHGTTPPRIFIAIQYLETLKVVADGQSTKLILPYEASALLGAVAGVKEIWGEVKE